jgi:hypothetical protein
MGAVAFYLACELRRESVLPRGISPCLRGVGWMKVLFALLIDSFLLDFR